MAVVWSMCKWIMLICCQLSLYWEPPESFAHKTLPDDTNHLICRLHLTLRLLFVYFHISFSWTKYRSQQSMWAERERDESLLTARGAVHNVRSSAQHLSTPLRSIPLSAQHRFYSDRSEITQLTRKKERKNPYHILQAAMGHITPPGHFPHIAS